MVGGKLKPQGGQSPQRDNLTHLIGDAEILRATGRRRRDGTGTTQSDAWYHLKKAWPLVFAVVASTVLITTAVSVYAASLFYTSELRRVDEMYKDTMMMMDLMKKK